MVTIVALGLVVWHSQTTKVSLDLRGVRLENAAPLLAKTFGYESLDIGPTIANDVLTLRVKDVDPAVLQEKIATALDAIWEHRPEGWRLTQSDTQKAAEKKLYEMSRFEYFSNLVAQSKAKLAKSAFDENRCRQLLREIEALSKTQVNPKNNSLWYKVRKLDDESPANRLGMRIGMRITPDMFMRLTDQNPRVVFSTNPTAMQLRLPFDVRDVIADTIRDQNLWASIAVGDPLKASTNGNQDDGFYDLGTLNENRQTTSTKEFATILVAMDMSGPLVEVTAYDAQGKSSFSSYLDFNDYGNETEGRSYSQQVEATQSAAPKLEGDALEYAELMAPVDVRHPAQKHTLSPSLLKKVMNPEVTDPLSISAPDVYLPAIKTPNVVMVMSEDQRSTRFADFANPDFLKMSAAKVTNENGWFLYSPKNPIQNRKSMADRKKLGPILRSIMKNGRPLSIEEEAAFVRSLPWEKDALSLYQEYIDLISESLINSGNSLCPLRVYGSLTSSQIDRAKKGGIPISSLSEDAKLEVFRAIYYSDQFESRLDIDDEDNPGNQTEQDYKKIEELRELVWNGILQEKTVAVPSGVQNNFILKIDENVSPMINHGMIANSSDEDFFYGRGQTSDPMQLGMELYRKAHPEAQEVTYAGYGYPDENNLRLASSRTISMTLQVGSKLHITLDLNQQLITNPKVFTAKTLPDDVRKQVEEGYKQAEQMYKEFGSMRDRGRSGQRTTPPPPPRSR